MHHMIYGGHASYDLKVDNGFILFVLFLRTHEGKFVHLNIEVLKPGPTFQRAFS